MKLKHVGVLQRQKKARSHHKQKYRKTKSVRTVRHRKSSVVWDVWKKKKKKSRERTDANTNNTAESPASHWSDGDVSSSHKVTPPEC